jgi:isohexenylglutaconyl-CoA hydratase
MSGSGSDMPTAVGRPCPSPEALPWQDLQVRRDGAVLHVTLHRPAARNALSLALVRELIGVLHAAEACGDVRVVVLLGSDGHFSAGADLKDMARAQAEPVSPQIQGTAEDPVALTNAHFGHLCAAYAQTGLTTVAVLQGTVMGGGFGLACAVDLTLADDSVDFRLPETSLGLLPAQIAPFLVERLGYAQARRLAVTGGRLNAAQALAIGLVHERAMPQGLEALLESALNDILRCAPGAIAATKRLMSEGRHQPPSAMIQPAALAFAQAARGEEAREGTAAFMGKRLPAWAGSTPCP